jgi:fatty-acyl-CoA synthase
MTQYPLPPVTLEEYERHPIRLIHAAVDHWAAIRPGDAAVINATRRTQLTWRELRDGSVVIASSLARLGLKKGDILAASLPLLDQHILLEYACFRLGVIHAPLDVRMRPTEALRCLSLIQPKAYAFPGKLGGADFTELATAARQSCPSIECLIQVVPLEPRAPGSLAFDELTEGWRSGNGQFEPVFPEDPAQIIFTTGSTGSPKPALLSHRGITCQNLCLARGFGFGPDQQILCNLPASHVGGQSELLMTSIYSGAVTVTLEAFAPGKSLDAMERFGITLIGQIPAMFQMEWRTPGFASRDFPALRKAVYGGQAVARPFLEQMLAMAPAIATGLGLTEASGFCTYTDLTANPDEIAQTAGWAMPAYPMSIREPMTGSGLAGAEMALGAVGHVCFRGPQNFLGYLNDAEATAKTLSSEGWLYTGDLGSICEHGLRLAGRAKWVLKPAGNQVFPGDIEAHFAALANTVGNVGVVGQPHRLWTEGIIAFVEKRQGAELSETELRRHARSLTSYMRPLHYVVLEPGAMPLNRIGKVDVVRLQELAATEVEALRSRGRWDS